MQKILLFALAIAAYGQQVTISDSLTTSPGNTAWKGRVVVSLNAPGNSQPLYYSTTSLGGWQYTLCVGVTGSDCSATTSAGVITIPLYATSTITPAGTSYSARFSPQRGAGWLETWVVGASDTKLYQVRVASTPTPTTLFSPSLLSLTAGSILYGSSNGTATSLAAGTNGHVLTLSGGYPTWAASSGGVTSITGTASQITASASTGAVTLSLPSNINVNTATSSALASSLTSTRVLFGQGTGIPATSSYLSWTDHTAALPTGVLTIGSGTQAFELAGRGTDSGVSHGVPYFRSAASNTNTAWDLMPNGNPATTAAGTVWMDVCSNDLQPLNSDAWNCAIFGVSGYVFHTNNGSLVSVVDSGSVATFTTLHPHRLTAGNSVVVSGGPSGLAATYTVATTPTTTTFTVATTGVSDGTYTTAGLVVSTAGNVVIGAHNTTNTAGATALLAGTSISFADRLGGTTRATLTGSKLGLGATETIAWYFNSGVQRMASTFVQRWSSTSSPDGTADISISRASAGVLQVGDGAANANGSITATTFTGALTGNASTATRFSTAASGTPASATAACATGAVQFDASFIYVCHATNTWKRAAVATW